MSLREVPLEAISLELFPTVAGPPTAVDRDDPLVVVEDEGKLLLVDGFKRYFALKEGGESTAWVLQKSWSVKEAKIERLKRNNPSRRTTLEEELEILRDLHEKEGLSVHALSRALSRRKEWVRRRFEILKRLCEEARDLLPERLFRPTVAHGLAMLPTAEQVATALAIQAAGLNVQEAIRFVRLLSASDSDEREALREDPRSAVEAAAVSFR